MKRIVTPVTAVLGVGSLLAMTQGAWAHPGHGGSGLPAGIAHPFTGVDHLAAMVAVGLWATQLGGKAIWRVPAAFVAMMAVGAGLAFAGVQVPFAEQGIAASVLVLGLLVVFAMRMPTWAGMALVGAFAVFHGWAHGQEMQMGTSAVAYGCGFLISTVVLHGMGIGMGAMLSRAKQQAWVRVAGLSVVGCAALLVAGAL